MNRAVVSLCPCPNMVWYPPLLTHTCPLPLQEDKCRLLPQLKPVPTEGGEREGEELLLNKTADPWMSTRDLIKVCACTHTRAHRHTRTHAHAQC